MGGAAAGMGKRRMSALVVGSGHRLCTPQLPVRHHERSLPGPRKHDIPLTLAWIRTVSLSACHLRRIPTLCGWRSSRPPSSTRTEPEL